MPNKNANTERFGGPGSSEQDRKHPEKFVKQEGPRPGAPTNTRSSQVSGGGGERDRHHSRNPHDKS